MLNRFLIPLTFFCLNAIGAEADHYSTRAERLNDGAVELNQIANSYLVKSVKNVNSIFSCDDTVKSETLLYKELTKYFANHSSGKLVKVILHDDYVTKRVIGLKDSVYQTWKPLNGFLLGRKKAADSPLALTPMIRVGDNIIGVDKLEHMFGMGQRYFKSYYLKGKNIRRILKGGIFKEKTILGGNIFATGVFSYGDLSANFNGMRFWNHILQKRDDILGADYNIGPYIECARGKWRVVEKNPIDFNNYIDDSMDESINCSKFATKSGLRKFKYQIKKIDPSYTCPMSVDKLEAMKDKYRVLTPNDRKMRYLSHWIINQDGNDDVSYLNEF